MCDTIQVQFGHAGSSAHSDKETAVAKNKVCQIKYVQVNKLFTSAFINPYFNRL